MNLKYALTTGGIATGVLAATALALPAIAEASTTPVTQHFDAKNSSAPLMLGRGSYILTDNDVSAGKTIGRDVLSCTDTETGSSHCHVAFAQNGGLLYATFAMSDQTGTLRGEVHGGTSSFAHAKGTLTGQAVSQVDVKITMHYTK